MKKIPYGIASYKSIRQQDCYYVDKTTYIHRLEDAGNYLFLIRPRRFGKSCLLTMLECYYDMARLAEFEALFKGTYIYDHPTPEKNSYLILNFNFSQIDPDTDNIEQSFDRYISNTVFFFYKKYEALFGDDFLPQLEINVKAYQKLEFTLNYIGFIGHKVYILIDEYDNFTNTILTTKGQSAYHELTHGAGFFRFFFNILKGTAGMVDTGVGRLFITGVSPVTMDDVTSGFNIGQNISLYQRFNELLGFSEQDVVNMLSYYQIPLDTALPLMKKWYDNYRFAIKVPTTLFNTDMVLFFVNQFLRCQGIPDELIDQNVRMDYTKLRHLLILDRKLNGNFSYLTEIIKTQGTSPIRVVQSFPVERLTKPSNFISLLYYFGLLSYTQAGELQIPNETVRQLMYGYLREGYEDVNVFNVDMWRLADLIRAMAYHGEWQPVFEFLAAEVERQTAIRDYLTGEKVIQVFLLAYLSVADYYIIHTEEELGKGFADLYLEPFLVKYADVQYAYLIELKYLTRNEFNEEKLKETLNEAKRQLTQYANDARFLKRHQGGQVIKVALVFAGWELKALESY